MNYRVVFSPEAQEQLAELFRYIAAVASPNIAARYTEAIVSYCESLQQFPLRGTKRDDIRPDIQKRDWKGGSGRRLTSPQAAAVRQFPSCASTSNSSEPHTETQGRLRRPRYPSLA
jgi:plasmid stabilization system protein ParE